MAKFESNRAIPRSLHTLLSNSISSIAIELRYHGDYGVEALVSMEILHMQLMKFDGEHIAERFLCHRRVYLLLEGMMGDGFVTADANAEARHRGLSRRKRHILIQLKSRAPTPVKS